MKRMKIELSSATDKVNAFELVLGMGSAGARDEWLGDKRTRTHVSIDVP